MSKCENLFQNLIWPAAAGNVAWSFFDLAIAPDCGAEHICARLLVLLILAFYLAYSCVWARPSGEVNCGYWIADGLHVLAIVVFALAVQSDRTWIEWSLCSVFAVTIVGHISGASNGYSGRDLPKRFCLAGCSLFGVLVLWGTHFLDKGLIPWNLSMAAGATLVTWFIANAQFGRAGYEQAADV